METPVIAMLTDFGLEDSYVAQMKAVLYNAAPHAHIADITHYVPSGDVLAGGYHLDASYRYFPEGTVFLCVVDPGVGTDRDIVAIKACNRYFVGPDNGLFGFLNHADVSEVTKITEASLEIEEASHTFHGRDIMAPAAIRIAMGAGITSLGHPRSRELVKVDIPTPRFEENRVQCEILIQDRFGNLITTLTSDMVPEGKTPSHAQLKNQQFLFNKTYGDIPKGERLCLWGSSGRLELSINSGSAADEANAKRFDPVTVVWKS